MATTTWNVSKDARIALNGSTSYGAGASPYSPAGLYSGYTYRALMGFSYSFSGMTAITSAVLWMKTSGQYYVAFGASPDMWVARQVASWSEGTSVGLSGSNAVEWSNQPGLTSANRASISMGTVENTWKSVDITALIQDAFAAGTFYGLTMYAQNEAGGGDLTEIWTREGSTANDPYIAVTYSTNTAPDAPTTPTPTSGTVVTGLTPTFQAYFSDPDAGDTMLNAQVIVYEDDGTTQKWDSGSFSATGSSFSKVYSGAALTGNTFYKWKGRTADASGTWGAYTALNRFKVNSTPNAPSISLTESPTSDVKTLTPTFNMTHSDPDASDSSMLGYHIILELTGGTSVWDSGDVSIGATVSKSITYSGSALSWQTGYRWRARTQDSNGAWGPYTTNATFTTHTAGVPIGLDPTGGVTASSLTPTLVGSRATSADSLTAAQTKVYASDGTTLIWDSGSFSSGVTSTAFSKVYAGTALSAATTYKWQARVTSSVGGTSSYSALQSFVTPDTNTPTITAPLGSGVTPVTNLNFTFTRGTNFNIHQLYLYSDAGGTTLVTSDTPLSYTATGSKTFVYSGTLSWNTTYYWKVRVSSDGGSNWSPYAGLVAFTTDAAGIPVLNYPTDASWLGAPRVIDEYDTTTSVTNGTSTSTSLETGSGLFQTGIGAVKIAISALANAATSFTYRTVSLDLSNNGSLTPFYIYIRYSSSTNVGTVRLRFRFATDSDFADYDVKPAAINTWYQKALVKGTPTATGGTVNWANVNKIGISLVASGGTVTTNVYIDDLKFDSVLPAFDGTTYNSEVISFYRIRVYASDQTTLVWDSGDVAGSSTTFAKLYAGTALTKGNTYYWQARYTKSSGSPGDYSALRSFVINSDPSVSTGLLPATGGTVANSIIPHFIAVFNDAEKAALGDFPTYMEVEIYRNSDSVLAYQLITRTGLVAASNELYDGLSGAVKVTGAAAPLVYETTYKWRVRYYDSKGARGTWSSYLTVKPTQSPTATISSPANSGTVASPSFTVTWGMTSPGSKGQNAYQVKVIRVADAVTLRNTGQVFSSATSYIVPSGYLSNSLQYDIQVTLWDTDLLSGVATNRVTATWSAPATIGIFTVTDDVSLSTNVLQWVQSNLADVDFRKYRIYRKKQTDTEWSTLIDLTNKTQVSYYDYSAANTVAYEYKITQFKVIPGDVDLESGDSDTGVATLDADSWFVVGADRASSHIFEVPVVSAPFTEPVQQEVFEPLGTSRKVIIRGRVMGAEGTLQGSWNTADRDTAIAQINYIKTVQGPHILKSPFGDVWQVEFSGPNKDYVSGGHVTVNITWTEVA